MVCFKRVVFCTEFTKRIYLKNLPFFLSIYLKNLPFFLSIYSKNLPFFSQHLLGVHEEKNGGKTIISTEENKINIFSQNLLLFIVCALKESKYATGI